MGETRSLRLSRSQGHRPRVGLLLDRVEHVGEDRAAPEVLDLARRAPADEVLVGLPKRALRSLSGALRITALSASTRASRVSFTLFTRVALRISIDVILQPRLSLERKRKKFPDAAGPGRSPRALGGLAAPGQSGKGADSGARPDGRGARGGGPSCASPSAVPGDWP